MEQMMLCHRFEDIWLRDLHVQCILFLPSSLIDSTVVIRRVFVYSDASRSAPYVASAQLTALKTCRTTKVNILYS